MTDSTGHYFIKNLPAGKITLVVSYIGYAQVSKTVELVRGRTMELNFEIEEESLSLSGTVVSASRNETDKKNAPAIVNVVSSKLFERTAVYIQIQKTVLHAGRAYCRICGEGHTKDAAYVYGPSLPRTYFVGAKSYL